MANVLTVVWLVIAYVVASTSMMVWAALMLPNPVGRAHQRLERHPVASFFLGAGVWALTFLFASALLKEGRHGLLQLMGWLIAIPGLAASVIGGGAWAQLLSERIRPKLKSEAQIPALIGGALCTALSGFVPVIGWIVFFPIVSFMAVGAGVVGLLRRAPKPQPVAQQYYTPAPQYYPAPAVPAPAATEPAGFILTEQPQ